MKKTIEKKNPTEKAATQTAKPIVATKTVALPFVRRADLRMFNPNTDAKSDVLILDLTTHTYTAAKIKSLSESRGSLIMTPGAGGEDVKTNAWGYVGGNGPCRVWVKIPAA